MERTNENHHPALFEELGDFLQQVRRERQRTQAKAAQDADIGRRTLLRWEAGQAQPRVPELHALLTTLNATEAQREHALFLLEAPRARRALRKTSPVPVVNATAPSQELPNVSSELLRAMRLRRHLPLDRVAAQLKIAPSTLSRWERGEVTPTGETRERLLTLLGAHPLERDALSHHALWYRELLHDDDAPVTMKTVTKLWEQWEQLRHVVYVHAEDTLIDLRFLLLEASLRQVADHPAGRQLLALVLAHYANHLLAFRRFKEARRYAERALSVADTLDCPAREAITLRAGIVAAGVIVYQGRRLAPRRGLERLHQYLPLAKSSEYVAWVRANEAEYLSLLGYPDDAVAQSSEACQIVSYGDGPVELALRQRDLAKLYLQWGRPADALPLIHDWYNASSVDRVAAALLRVQALHALRDPTAATHLSAALADITTYNLTHLKPQADLLAKRLR